MGFLDKLLGRAKETAGEVAEKAAPMVDTAQESAAQAWDKTKDVAGDVVHEAKEKVSERGDGDEAAPTAPEAASEGSEETSGSSPTAA